MTVEPTNDVMAGILPVNNETKDGEGFVTFDVLLKGDLNDGTAIDNHASIIFDKNDAIDTPTWSNETDYVLPVSYVSAINNIDESHIKLNIDGIDSRSGIWKYDLYYQPGEGSAWFLLKEDIKDDFYNLEVYKDIDYGFCVIATDKAGNKEIKELAREYSYKNGIATTSVEQITIDDLSKYKRIYDLSGKRIQGKPHVGIYIINKKKVIVSN